MTGAGRDGFTLAEVLVATVLLGFVLVGLHQAHLRQRTVTLWQQRVTGVHDGYRVANSIVSAELREARLVDGDVRLPAPDSMVVRSPIGFGIVCGTGDRPSQMGVTAVQGTLPTQRGDSVLLHTTGGWRAMEVGGVQRPGRNSATCPYGEPVPEVIYRMPGGVVDSLATGAPLRAFRTHAYHRVSRGGQSWLARTDGSGTWEMVGPLGADGLRFQFLDAAGDPTRDPRLAEGIEMRLVLTAMMAGGSTYDTLTMVFQGRNR